MQKRGRESQLVLQGARGVRQRIAAHLGVGLSGVFNQLAVLPHNLYLPLLGKPAHKQSRPQLYVLYFVAIILQPIV